MSDYKTMNSTISSLQNRLVLPKFQRGYVWTQVKQLELIESLHKGYPFGALLTYAPKNSDEEKLLDGQQLWTLNTIRQSISRNLNHLYTTRLLIN